MNDSDPTSSDKAPSRPSRPEIRRPSGGQSGRPVRPGSGRSRAVELPAVDLPPPEPVIAETVLIAPPPEPELPKPPRPPMFASRDVRQTLIPPCGVLGIGFLGLGTAYFLQPADAALRQLPAIGPIILLAMGGVCIGCLIALIRSVASH